MKVNDQNHQIYYDRRSNKDRRKFEDNIMPPNMRKGIDRRVRQIGIYIRELKGFKPDMNTVPS